MVRYYVGADARLYRTIHEHEHLYPRQPRIETPHGFAVQHKASLVDAGIPTGIETALAENMLVPIDYEHLMVRPLRTEAFLRAFCKHGPMHDKDKDLRIQRGRRRDGALVTTVREDGILVGALVQKAVPSRWEGYFDFETQDVLVSLDIAQTKGPDRRRMITRIELFY